MELNETYTQIGYHNNSRPADTYGLSAVLGLSPRRGPPQTFRRSRVGAVSPAPLLGFSGQPI